MAEGKHGNTLLPSYYSRWSGMTTLGHASLQVETTALARDSTVARMAELVAKAAAEQSPLETLVMKFARVYTPAVVAACILIAFLPWAFDSQHHKVLLIC